MFATLENLLRRARLRGGREGPVQTMRAESLENDAKDQAERWQDYGFSAHPVDGQGLVIHAGGHTIVLRVDRIAERPELAAYEVAVWHKEGHYVKLKDGRAIEMSGDSLVINMANSVTVNTQVMELNAPTMRLNADELTLSANSLGMNAANGVGRIGVFTLIGESLTHDIATVAVNGASLTHNGKDVGDTHTHSGVAAGPADTGQPN